MFLILFLILFLKWDGAAWGRILNFALKSHHTTSGKTTHLPSIRDPDMGKVPMFPDGTCLVRFKRYVAISMRHP